MRLPRTWLSLLACYASLAPGSAVPTFDRTVGEVDVGTCAGLKRHVELGLDVSVKVVTDLLCSETIALSQGQQVSIASAPAERYMVVIAEAFVVTDSAAATLIVNPSGASLTLERLLFLNEAGSTGPARAVWNEGMLDVAGCEFVNLNFASRQSGGAIYSIADPSSTSDSDGFVSVSNSSFLGNLASEYGGAILAEGAGAVELSNCSFSGNEAVGTGDVRRSGSGGAVYASPGVFVTVQNSSFEGCLGRYGGSALFLCGGEVVDSTFDGNEATGLFGAVVNGDLDDEDRINAAISLGVTAPGENYTCPGLTVSGTSFEDNIAASGYGAAIASVDAALSVYNSSVVDTVGGALYFGTSSRDGRDWLELDLVLFNSNEGSESSPDLVGSAFLVELIGAPASNTTGTVTPLEPTSTATTAAVQSVGGDPLPIVGIVRDLYCFQNDPYECEGYLGDATIELAGAQRCSACEGAAFTGIGSAQGAPTPAPVGFDDDDGLSKMGQERAQGGTPSPTPAGGLISSSGSGSADAAALDRTSDTKLFGVTGDMRWVVIGLIAGLSSAILICLCIVTVCRVSARRKREDQLDQDSRSAVGPRAPSPPEGDAGGFLRGIPLATARVASVASSPTEAMFFAVSPGGTTVVPGSTVAQRPGSRRDSHSMTPASQRKNREVARQRVIQMSAEADRRAEDEFWQSPKHGWGASGEGMAVTGTPNSSKRGSFTALPETETFPHQQNGKKNSSTKPGGRGRDGHRSAAPGSFGGGREAIRGTVRGRATMKDGVPVEKQAMTTTMSGRHRNWRSGETVPTRELVARQRSRSLTPEKDMITPEKDLDPSLMRRIVKTPAGGARLPIRASPSALASAAASGTGAGGAGSQDNTYSSSAGKAAARPMVSRWVPDTIALSEDSLEDERRPKSVSPGPKPRRARSRSKSGSTSHPRAIGPKPSGSRKGREKGRAEAAVEVDVDGDRDGGWAAQLYRSPPPAKMKSSPTRVENGGVDSAKSDWSAEGVVEWNRHADDEA